MKVKKNKVKNRLVVASIILSGLVSYIGLSNYFKVVVLNRTDSYLFGKEEVSFQPYFYKTPELFSMVNLILVFSF